MNNAPSKAHSAVSLLAQQVRDIALSVDEGEYIGSEESLTRKFGSTGPTLRQAIRLLEHEGIIRVRRGVKGGYYAARPDLGTVSRVAAVYLRGSPHSIEDVGLFLRFIQPLLIDLVLASGRLQELAPFAEPGSTSRNYPDFVEVQSRFTDLLWNMSGNAPLQLIYAVFYQLGDRVVVNRANRLTDSIIAIQEMRIGLAQALIAKDRDRAIELARKSSELINEGIKRALKNSRQNR